MFFIWWSFRLTWAQGFQNCSYRHYFSGFCYPSLFINLLFFLLSFQLYVLGFNIVYFYCTIISLHLSTHQNDYIFTILFNVFLFFSTFTLLKSLVRCSLRYNIFFFSKSKRREEKKSKILLILVFFPVDEKYKSSLSVPTCYVCHRRLSQCHLMSREKFLLIHKRIKKKCTYCPMSRLVVVFLSIATWLLQRFFPFVL